MSGRVAPAAFLALALLPAAAAGQDAGQGTDQDERAQLVARGSFQLPGKDRPEGPEKPVAVAAGRDGSVHVVDERGRVFVYDSAGEFQRLVGRKWKGKLAAVAVDSAGSSYVLNREFGRVFVVSPGGESMRTWGVPGERWGELKNPVDVAVGPSQFVYVLDRGHDAVQIFASDGTYLRAVVLPDAFSDPISLAVARNGRILVGFKGDDGGVVSLPRFPLYGWISGTLEAETGRATGRNQRAVLYTREPRAVAVTSRGLVAAADGKNRQILGGQIPVGQESAGQRLLYGGRGSGRGAFREIEDVALASPDELLVLDRKLRKVERIRLPHRDDGEPLPLFRYPIRPSRVRHMLEHDLLEIERRGGGQLVFVEEAGDGRIRLIGGTRKRFRAPTGETFEQYRREPASYELSLDVSDVDEIGDVAVGDSLAAVTDPGRDRFLVFRLRDGTRLGSYGHRYRDERRLKKPHGVAILEDGRIAICDRDNDRVAIFSTDLTAVVERFRLPRAHGVVHHEGQLYAWGRKGETVIRVHLGSDSVSPIPPSLAPRPVAHLDVDGSGNLVSLNAKTGRLTVSQPDLDGVLVQMARVRELEHPRRVLADPVGNFYAMDRHPDESKVFRWDVLVPEPGAPRVAYRRRGGRLSWDPGPVHLLAGYRVDGAPEPGGPFRELTTADSAHLTVGRDTYGEPPPVFVRVVPVLVTGGHGPPSEVVPLHHLAAFAAHSRQQYERSLTEARKGLEALAAGRVQEGDDQVRRELLWTAFTSASELSQHQQAVRFGERLRELVSGERLVEYHVLMARSQLQTDAPEAASEELLEFLEGRPGPETAADRALVSTSFDVADALGMGSGESSSAGARFLESYRASLPPGTSGLHRRYSDSLRVFRTRAALGKGLELWDQVQFQEVIAYFQARLAENRRTGALNLRQRVLCSEFIAAAQYALGKRNSARETFRRIFMLDPVFDVAAEHRRLQQRYGVSPYSGKSMRSFFEEVQSDIEPSEDRPGGSPQR